MRGFRHSTRDNCAKVRVPGLANVDNVDTIWASLPEVWLHVHLEVLGTEVALGSEEHLNVLRGGVESRWEVGRGHFVELSR